MRQQIKCSKKQIADYWTQSGRLGADYEGVSALYENECFACRYTSNGLERAHILADCLGGSAGADNLHLLCSKCHVQSELLQDKTYWRWIIKRRSMPKFDPIREHIRRLKEEFGIDVFNEMQVSVEQASTLSDLESYFRSAVLLPHGANASDHPIKDQDKAEAFETIKHLRDWYETTKEPIPIPGRWWSA